MVFETSQFFEEHRLNSLLENVQEGLWVYDRSFKRYIYFNDTISKIYERSESDFSRNLNLWGEVVFPEDCKIFEKASIGLLKHGIVDSKYRIVLPDGRTKWIKDKRKLLRDHNHFPRWVIGLVTNINDSILSQEELAETDVSFQILFHENTTPMCIYEKNDFRILEVNSSLIHILGYRYDEFLEKKIIHFLHKDELEAFLEDQTRIQRGIETKLLKQRTFRFIGNHGSVRYFSTIYFSSIFHGFPSIIALFFDKTESYLYEEKIKALNLHLTEQNEHLKKIAFMNAHQVRGPLTTLLGLVDLITKDASLLESNIHDLQNTARNLDQSIRTLSETINRGDMLEYSEIHLKDNILIFHIDDDPIQLKICEMIFKKISPNIKYQPFFEAINAIEEMINNHINPDIIFLDLNMPELDGWGFLESLKREGNSTPVCVLSSTNDPEDIVRSRQFENVKGFLIKPLSLEKLKNFLPLSIPKE
jgi:PAS domain S-box-containing protein